MESFEADIHPHNEIDRLGAAFTFRNLRPTTKDHLMKVYGYLVLMMFSCAFGVLTCAAIPAIQDIPYWILGSYSYFIQYLLVVCTIYALICMGEDLQKPLIAFAGLLSISYLLGIVSSELILVIWWWKPAIVVNAFVYTLAIFGSLSLAAIMNSNSRAMFYFFGGGMSLGIPLALTLIYCMVVQSAAAFYKFWSLLMVIGLLVNFALIVYDTQLIIWHVEEAGSTCAALHALLLFEDLLRLFRFLLIIMGTQESNRERRRN